MGRVINEVDPENQWVFTDEGVKATRKYDGTACAVIGSKLYKRYDSKHGKPAPANGIPCQEPDAITGHWPHWVPCIEGDPASKYHFEAFNKASLADGTYELCGPKIQGNPEGLVSHELIEHGIHILEGLIYPLTFIGLREYLQSVNIEGIVFHHPDGRMCKLRKSDFGLKRIKP